MPESSAKAIYTTPQQAEAAFYEAIERADLDAMMAVWAEDEEIVCIHPGGPRMRFTLANPVHSQGMLLSVHSLHENIILVGESRRPAPVVVTNVYIRGALGWRMLVHHASPGPAGSEAAIETPKTVH